MSSRDPLICHVAAQKTPAEDSAQRQAFKAPTGGQGHGGGHWADLQGISCKGEREGGSKRHLAYLETNRRPNLIMAIPFETGIEATAKKRAKYTDAM